MKKVDTLILHVGVAWAFAKTDQVDAQLVTALARAAEQRMGHFKVQELANTAWAFATVSLSDEELFTALARAAEPRLSEFSS